MPLLMTSGCATSQAFGSGTGYVKPSMVRTGATGTITDNAAGYALSGFSDSTYAYLDAGKSAGKWYWEQVVGNYVLSGVTTTPSTSRTFGGYASSNAGVYNFTGDFWNEWGTDPTSYGTISPGAVLRFALDVGGKTLDIYVNGGSANTLALTSITTPIYPMFAMQGAPNTQIKLGPGNTTYSPPTGYAYI